MISAERVITTLPIRKPGPQEYFRVHPDSEYSEIFLVIEDKADRETYIVHPSLQSEFAAEARQVQIVLGMARTYPFLWALKLPGADGRSNGWNESAMVVAELAKTVWVKINANKRRKPMWPTELSAISPSQFGPINHSTNCLRSRSRAA